MRYDVTTQSLWLKPPSAFEMATREVLTMVVSRVDSRSDRHNLLRDQSSHCPVLWSQCTEKEKDARECEDVEPPSSHVLSRRRLLSVCGSYDVLLPLHGSSSSAAPGFGS